MNLGIYKPGQGYWVRTMTAVLIGLITVVLAAWMNEQGNAAAEWLPKKQWSASVASTLGTPAVGGTVALTSRADEHGKTTRIGTATLAEYDGTARVARLKDIVMDAGKQPSEIAGVVPPTGEAFTLQLSRPKGDPPIAPGILGGGLAVLVVILGAAIGYWVVGVRVKSVEFLIATDFEMKKVNWSSPREVMGHTWVVIGACLLLALTLYLIDTALNRTFTWIGLLS